jgi:hypothetical protein
MDEQVRAQLRAALPRLLPGAIAWAESQAAEAAANGVTLSDVGTGLARRVGVQQPELIRVAVVDSLPIPQDPVLQQAAILAGLLGPGMTGLTLGHSVFAVRGHDSIRLLSHEFRHVHQYETIGSIAGFLREHLPQVIEVGYHDSPYEIDARAHEVPELGGPTPPGRPSGT